IDALDVVGSVTVDPQRVSPGSHAAGPRTDLDPGCDAVGCRVDADNGSVPEVARPEVAETAVLGAGSLPGGDSRDDACRLQGGGRRHRAGHQDDQNGECDERPRHGNHHVIRLRSTLLRYRSTWPTS